MNEEERMAEENLEEAIKDLLVVKGMDDGLLVSWVLISAQHVILDDDHEQSGATATALHTPHTQATYQTEGLIDYGKHVIARKYRD